MDIIKFLRHLNCKFSEAEYDEIECAEIVLKSGHKIIWNEKDRSWEVDQETCDHEMKLMTGDDGKCYPYNTSWSYWECEICGATKEPGPHDHYDPEF